VHTQNNTLLAGVKLYTELIFPFFPPFYQSLGDECLESEIGSPGTELQMSPSLFEFLSGTAEREKKPKKSVAGRNANVRSIQASFCLTSSPCSQRHQTARRATEQGGVQRTGRSLMPAGGPPKGRKSSSLNMHPKIFVNMWKMILQHSHCHGTAPQWVCSFGTSLPACPPHPTHAEG